MKIWNRIIGKATTAKNIDIIDWWVETVLLTLFPIICALLINLCRSASIADINRLIGDGELVLSAFLITTPSVFKIFKANSSNKDKDNKDKDNRKYKVFLYTLFFIVLFQLVAYVTIKTTPISPTPENTPDIPVHIYIISFVCLASSIFTARGAEIFLKGGAEK